jgi:sortase A
MSRKQKSPEDLSITELRRLLMEKRRSARQERLELFRRTGRVLRFASDSPPEENDDFLDVNPVVETSDAPPESPEEKNRRWMDRLLLAVEVMAVLGLIAVMLNGLGILRELNQEVAAAIEQPTLTPTPLIMAVVLPSGHIPPDENGNTRPNDAEIPEHLRPMVQSLADVPVPTPSVEQAVRIQIPALHVDAPIVQGDGWEQLKKGVGQHIGSANPGEPGNVVLSAHNDVYGELFRYLDQLKPGDPIYLYTQQKQYVYIVTSTQIVEPTQVEVMADTPDPTLTLISCYPYMKDKQRIVVFAKLLENP